MNVWLYQIKILCFSKYFDLISMSLMKIIGGAEEDRTPDPLRARQVLSQLSYDPNLLLSSLSMLLICSKQTGRALGFFILRR